MNTKNLSNFICLSLVLMLISCNKTIDKRVAIVASVTFMVYQIGDCLEWW